MRDDFSPKIIESLAKRVGYRCSNPDCRQLTSGPQADVNKAVNVGVAAHITAASPGGPRFDINLTAAERKSISNGIWLCQKCAKLVDNDSARYTVEKLQNWKKTSEEIAIREVEGFPSASNNSQRLWCMNIFGPTCTGESFQEPHLRPISDEKLAENRVRISKKSIHAPKPLTTVEFRKDRESDAGFTCRNEGRFVEESLE